MNRFTPIASAGSEAGQAPGERRYWAFLSYAHADAKAAARLHSALERFKVPVALVGKPHPLGTIPSRLAPVFRDRQELAAASNLGREIAEALEKSSYFIVLCSPSAARSRWVEQEIREFQRLHGPERILAAILDGDPGCGEDGRECFPPALREEGMEPIAADLRAAGDGWRGGFLKLVAGMLDVGLDELVQRDQQRRQKRMAWIAAASMVGMASTSGLALFAIDQRDAARDERRQAEGLVEFMLGDLKSKLEPIGKLEALDGVGSKILDYYSKQDAAALDDASLVQRSRALSLTAQVAHQRGRLGDAERLYRQAMVGTGEAVARAPGNAERLFEHAQNVFWVGEMARSSGRPQEAERAYREYQRLAQAMVAIDPVNLRYRMEVVYAAENIGIALLNRRRFAEASALLAPTVKPMAAMAAAYPDNADYQREYSTLLAWAADARRDEGRLSDAEALRKTQIAHLNRALRRAGSHVGLRNHLIPAHRALGILKSSQGRNREALEEFRRSTAEAEQLLAVEPENAQWRGYAAGTRLHYGATLLALDRVTEASSEVAAGCALTAALFELEPNSSTARGERTLCRMLRARIALARGDVETGLSLATQALGSARQERSSDPLNSRYRIAGAYRLIGDAHRRQGNPGAARTAWAAGLAELPRNVPERPHEMHERVQLLERLGRHRDAGPLNARLAAIGFESST